MTPEDILARHLRALDKRRAYDSLWQDCYDHVLPAMPAERVAIFEHKEAVYREIVGEVGPVAGAVALLDWAERTRSQSEIQQQIQGTLDTAPGVQGYVFAPPSLPGAGGGLPISMVIQSIHSPDRVFEIAEEIRLKAMQSGMFMVVQNSLSFDAPQVRIVIDRDRAANLGVAVSDIGSTLGLLVGGGAIAQFDRDSNSYDIVTQVPAEWRDNPERLTEFFVRARSGAMVPLSSR